jgi:hypothetical protein
MLFEIVFDDKPFSQQNKEKVRSNPLQNAQPNPDKTPSPFPCLLPATALTGGARSGSQGWLQATRRAWP